MRHSSTQIVFQEVPGEISLAFSITGCDLRCRGCHSAHTWDATVGDKLDEEDFIRLLSPYQHLISCVLFYGGEWDAPHLVRLAKLTRERNLLACLYTGRELSELPRQVLETFDFIKTGKWRPELGGLPSPSTNQRFYRVELLNGVTTFHDQTDQFRG